MSPLLNNPAIRQRATFITLADYHRMLEAGAVSERTELIDGAIVDKMTKSPAHNYFVGALYEQLRTILPDGLLIMTEKTLTHANSDVEPDLMIVKGPLASYRERNPATAELVVEVARSSLEFDRAKATIYAAAGVPVYWIVDLDGRRVEIFEEPLSDGYAKTREQGFADGLAVFGKTVMLAEI